MRYNKTYHQRADKLAKVHGYEFAVYMGHYCTKKSTWLAFVPHENDNLFRKTGLLNYILINERRAIWQSSSVFNLPFMQYDYFKRGRTLFREIESNYFQHCLDGDENHQNQTYRYLVGACFGCIFCKMHCKFYQLFRWKY